MSIFVCENLDHHVRHEFLATETRFHGHHENHVNIGTVIQNFVNWRAGFYGYARFHARFPDFPNQGIYKSIDFFLQEAQALITKFWVFF